MTTKSVSLTLVLFLNLVACYGQQQVGRNIGDHLLIKIAQKDLYGDPEKETIGSPYLKDDFSKGTVYATNRVFTDVLIRYDMYNDYMEFKQGDQTYILDPEPRVKRVILDNNTFTVLKYPYRGKLQHGYLQQLDSGKISLFAKKIVTYREWQAPKALESAATPAKFTRGTDLYFYKIGDGEVLKVESLKKMIESLPDKQTELTQFAKQEKLGVKDEEDLRKLLQYYNSL